MIRLLVFLLFISSPIYARDLGQYTDSPNKAWFAKQRNSKDVPCCDIADGKRLEDADWKGNSDGTYSVLIDGKWIPVPPEAVINPKDRPISFAVIWIYNGIIECFLPGAGA